MPLHTVRANLDWLVSEKNAQYIAIVKRNQPLLHAQVSALPWRQVPAGSATREKGHGRAETRTLKAAHVSGLDFPHARQAIKVTRWRRGTATGRISRQAVYAVTSLTSAEATSQDLARLVREQWSIEAHHHVRDLTFGEDAAASRTGSGPVNLATIRAAVTAALKDAGYLHIPEGRRDHTTPARPSPPRLGLGQIGIHGTRRSRAAPHRHRQDHAGNQELLNGVPVSHSTGYRSPSSPAARAMPSPIAVSPTAASTTTSTIRIAFTRHLPQVMLPA